MQISKDGNTYFTLKDVDEQGRLYLGKSGLAQNGVFVLTRGTYIDDQNNEQEILVKDWTYLDYAILKPAGMWYMVETADSGEMYIQFPANFDSLLADRQIVVYATYTDGAASNVAQGIISRFVNDTDWRSYFAVQQPAAFYTGQDAESIDLATKHYYETKDVCNTLVSASDYVAALKNLVISATFATTDNSDKVLQQGANYLSNAIVRTAADRKTKILTTSFGTEYQLFVPDTDEPSNQIDVTAMSPLTELSSTEGVLNNDYARSFRVMGGTDANSQALENSFKGDFEQQLQDNTAVDVNLNITPISNDLASQRLLAVTTPEVTVRMSNYTNAAAIQLKAKIQNYFYSTYQAKNLTPGVRLDVQKIIDDIKALSPSIVFVSVADLDYTIYQKYQQVDGVADVQLSVEPDLDDSYVPRAAIGYVAVTEKPADWDTTYNTYYKRSGDGTANSPYTYQLNTSVIWLSTNCYKLVPGPTELQKEILARSVLQGSVPLYKYLNRQNTKSKESYVYATAIGETAVAQSEHVNFVPFDASNYEALGSGVPVAPVITEVTLPSAWPAVPSDSYYYYPLFYENQIVQFRKPSTVASASYGFGTKYTFIRLRNYPTSDSSDDADIVNATTLTAGTYLYRGSKIIVPEGTFDQYDAHYFTKTTSDGNDIFTVRSDQSWTVCLLTTTISNCTAHLMFGSKVAPGSLDEDGDPLFNVPETIQDGQEYTLTEGEVLTIKKSSDGSTVVELGSGDIIQPSGIALSATNGSDSSVLMTSQSISVLGLDETVYGSEYQYYLSASSGIPAEEEGMLEEHEFLVIANKGVTEYITFGPGTQIVTSEGVVLEASSAASLEEVSQNMFKPLEGNITVRAYEFETYLQNSVVRSLNKTLIEADKWEPCTTEVQVFSDIDLSSVENQNGYSAMVAGKNHKDYSGNWEYRRVYSLVSDANGLAFVGSANSDIKKITVKLKATSDSAETTLGGTSGYSYISSSVPFSFLAAPDTVDSQPMPLLSYSTEAYVSQGSYAIAGITSYPGITVDGSLPGVKRVVFGPDVGSRETGAGIIAFNCPTFSANSNSYVYYLTLAFDKPVKFPSAGDYITVTVGNAAANRVSFTEGGFVYLSLGSDWPSAKNIKFACSSDAALAACKNNVLTITAFSVVSRYASELGVDSANLKNNNFSTLFATLDAEKRFNYAAYPTTAFTYPLSANSFFASEHPANAHTFPYIALDTEKIKILSSRS